MRMVWCRASPFMENAALAKLGGPNRTRASRENPNPSWGSIKRISSRPLAFSSWIRAIAYWPGGTSRNSNSTAPDAGTASARASGSFSHLGNAPAFAVRQASTCPLSDRSPVTVALTLLSGGGAVAAVSPAIAKHRIRARPGHGRSCKGDPRTGNRGHSCMNTARDVDDDGLRLSASGQTANEQARAETAPSPCDW